MTRKDFELIARVIGEIDYAHLYDMLHKSEGKEDAVGQLFMAHIFASGLRSTNHNFDKDRFIRACTAGS